MDAMIMREGDMRSVSQYHCKHRVDLDDAALAVTGHRRTGRERLQYEPTVLAASVSRPSK
ncbi:MAG: hypothetical protein WDN04_13885 [Rhodospirillales bacterium]